jgi:glycosyltransferase involved in cell wall biosynthesis
MKSDSSVHVDLFGDIDSVHSKDYFEKLISFSENNNLLGRITFRGFDVSVVKKFRNYKCLILPSLEEAMGRVIIESFIEGIIPIVLDADTGAKELITKMGLVELLFVNRANSLWEKINYIISLDQESYNRIILTGQYWILANLNDEEYLKKINSIYA